MIRAAALADVPALVAMGERFVRDSEYSRHLTVDPATLAQTMTWLVSHPSAGLWVLTIDGVLAGMLAIVLVRHIYSGQTVASELFWYIEPSARGQGVRLLRHGERWAEAHGATSLQMIAPTEAVEGLYVRLGYRQVETMFAREF